jgi:hypothetical protein
MEVLHSSVNGISQLFLTVLPVMKTDTPIKRLLCTLCDLTWSCFSSRGKLYKIMVFLSNIENGCTDIHLHYGCGCVRCHAIQLVDECIHFGRTCCIIHIHVVKAWTYTFFLKMKAAGFSEIILVNQTDIASRKTRCRSLLGVWVFWMGWGGGSKMWNSTM